MVRKFYDVCDSLNQEERKKFDLTGMGGRPMPSIGQSVLNIHAVRTGEFRQPKEGEWYLSGAIPQAYRAFHDLATEFHIMRLVKTKTVTLTTIEVE